MSRAHECSGVTPSIQLGVKSNIAQSSFPRRRESSISIVIPVFDYMDVVGRATQEAKAEGSRIRAYTDVFAACLRSVQANVQEFGTLI